MKKICFFILFLVNCSIVVAQSTNMSKTFEEMVNTIRFKNGLNKLNTNKDLDDICAKRLMYFIHNNTVKDQNYYDTYGVRITQMFNIGDFNKGGELYFVFGIKDKTMNSNQIFEKVYTNNSSISRRIKKPHYMFQSCRTFQQDNKLYILHLFLGKI